MIPQHIEPEVWLRARLTDQERPLSPADAASVEWALAEIDRLRRIEAERDALAAQVVQMREALEQANAGIEQIHDDWLEPESWNSAGCGQAAAHCLAISLSIDAALALTRTAAERQESEWRGKAELLDWWFDEANEASRTGIRVLREMDESAWSAERWIAEIKAAKEASNGN